MTQVHKLSDAVFPLERKGRPPPTTEKGRCKYCAADLLFNSAASFAEVCVSRVGCERSVQGFLQYMDRLGLPRDQVVCALRRCVAGLPSPPSSGARARARARAPPAPPARAVYQLLVPGRCLRADAPGVLADMWADSLMGPPRADRGTAAILTWHTHAPLGASGAALGHGAALLVFAAPASEPQALADALAAVAPAAPGRAGEYAPTVALEHGASALDPGWYVLGDDGVLRWLPRDQQAQMDRAHRLGESAAAAGFVLARPGRDGIAQARRVARGARALRAGDVVGDLSWDGRVCPDSPEGLDDAPAPPGRGAPESYAEAFEALGARPRPDGAALARAALGMTHPLTGQALALTPNPLTPLAALLEAPAPPGAPANVSLRVALHAPSGRATVAALAAHDVAPGAPLVAARWAPASAW